MLTGNASALFGSEPSPRLVVVLMAMGDGIAKRERAMLRRPCMPASTFERR
jgi:hypothetical protein